MLIAPAMNPQMWAHAATRRNVATLSGDGIRMVGPNPGDMACGEIGLGRMAEPDEIVAAIEALLQPAERPLQGIRALVTSGPTHEAIDPVRFIANRSSGKQGHAIAAALAAAGADVTLVSGPVQEPDPPGVRVVRVESALQMLEAAQAAGPTDVAVCAAAVADWRVAEPSAHKVKRQAGAADAGAARESGHPEDALAGGPDAAEAGDRLCRRDGRCAGQRAAQACEQGLRLDRRQRCFYGTRRLWRR